MKKYLLFLSLILLGCGSRKVELHKSEKQIENDVTTDSEAKLTYNVNRMVLEPFNPERAILINGKEYHNTKIVYEKENGVKEEKTKTEDKSESEESIKDKTTERDNTMLFAIIGIGVLMFFFFIFIVIIVVMYMYFKRMMPKI